LALAGLDLDDVVGTTLSASQRRLFFRLCFIGEIEGMILEIKREVISTT